METTIITILVIILVFNSDQELILENIALRQQLSVIKQSIKRPKIRKRDHAFWMFLSRFWKGWRNALIIVTPETVIRWHRKGFKLFWTFKSRKRKAGRFPIDAEIKKLIQDMAKANPLWGAPRIHGEFLKLGIDEVISAPKSSWQNPYVERIVGSIRRDCPNHVIVLSEKHLKRILTEYFEYYLHDRTHFGLSKNTPLDQRIQNKPKNCEIVVLARLGGLHHRYECREVA